MLTRLARLGIATVAILAWTGALCAAESGAVSLDLVRDGKPAATIVVANQATRSARLAAAELQYHVQKIAGAVLPIVDDTQRVDGNRVLVGESKATTSLGLRGDEFAPQEYLIRFQPGLLILIGRDKPEQGKFDYADAATFPALFDEQGTCYATYDFLERFCQVRWYLPTELGLVCPAGKTLQVSGSELRRAPAMKYRYVHIGYQIPLDLCGDTVRGPQPTPVLPWREQMIFAMRHRLGGTPFAVNHSLYGYYDRFWTEAGATPGPAFEQSHPEYFAQGYQGRPPQMCYTNPGLVRQVVQDARDYFDGKPAKPGSVAIGDFFAVVPMDNSSYCRCPRCTSLVGQKKPATRGNGQFSNDSASNYLFAFVNQVASEVKKSHPQKHIAAIAYSSYAYPPSEVKLESNIWVKLCLHARNIYLPALQENDMAILKAWIDESKERPKLLWLYYCFPSLNAVSGQFRCFPGFFAHTIVRQMKVYHQAGISGISYEPSYLAYERRSPLLDQLEFYVTWKLADDPSRDGNAMIDEFFDRYYGSAAGPMKAFYELVEQTYATQSNYAPGFNNHQTEEAAWKYLGTQSRMTELGRLMDQARAAAKTEVERQRVALFDKGIWQYMQAGRKAYLQRTSAPGR